MKTLLFVFVLILLSSFLYSTIINIPTDQPTIQEGITAAANNDTVLIQPGTYLENINYIGKNITVCSQFLTTQDTAYISSTIIDGNATGSVVTFTSGEDSTAILCGFTITNGLANFGSGIYCNQSSPTLHDLTISGNSANNSGGGINCYINSNPYIKNVSISGNSSVINGGGIYSFGSNPSLKNVVISGNSASYGGGISCNENSSLDLMNVTISGNTASNAGGGIECYNNSNPNLTNCILWNDSPQEIFLTSSSLTATYSDIEGDWAGIGNIDSDPLFVDVGTGDYHLQSGSPCIDAGDPVSPIDPDGTITDMGAFYYNQYNGPVWYISTTGSDITGIGTEEFPFATIQHGIDSSSDTDTVLVQPGTYIENLNYNGKNITVASLFLTTQDPSYISSTIIDGNNTNSVVKIESGENSTTVLCGFTITNGSLFGGGGINCYASNPSLQYLLITGNSANYGGGIWIYEASPSLENVTISGNTASVEGGGIYYYNTNSTMINSIHWINSPQEISGETGSITATYSDIQGGWAGTGNIDSDPLFVNPSIGDYNLQLTSPCIDAGDPSSPLDPNGTVIEMGAYYFPQPLSDFTADVTSGNSPFTVNFTDLSIPGAGVIDEWYWDFGDGNNSTLQNPSNEYILPGNHTVSLTVTDDTDVTDVEIKVDYISITPPFYSGPMWHISTTGSDIIGNGSELYPFATIQHGIDSSSDTDTVLVQPGTYVENIDYNGKNVTISSLFLTTQDTTYISNTIIDGNSAGSVVTFNSGEDSTAVLSGFTITNGSNSGIICYVASPTLTWLKISRNYSFDGGGLFCEGSSAVLRNVALLNNDAGRYSGGVYCAVNSELTLENVTISRNYASGPYDGDGIYCSGSDLTVRNSIIHWNGQIDVFLDNSSSSITYSDIDDGGWAGIGNIDSWPLFVDYYHDYHLQATSPCIDTGDPMSPLDPDGTRADMGAYYYHQDDVPPTAEFISDTTQGYSPLTVNLTNLSTHGSVSINDWYWDFGDGNNSSLQDPSNEYLIPGIYTVSLTVTDINDSTDTETKIDYISVFGNDPPAPPTDVDVDIIYPDAIISWTAVDTTIYGDPTFIDGYVISYSEIPDDEYFWFLAFSTSTNYTHQDVALHSPQMFYKVVSYVDLSREEIEYLNGLNGNSKIRWLDVKNRLKRRNYFK